MKRAYVGKYRISFLIFVFVLYLRAHMFRENRAKLAKMLASCASHATRLSVSPIDLRTNLAQKNALCLCLFVAPRALCCA